MINKKQFIDYLLKICEGKEIVYDNVGKDMIKLPNKIIFDKNISIKLFILKIFYNFDDNYKNKIHLDLYPVEFLNTLIPSGTPSHKLVLKKGVSIILLQNLNPVKGLYNSIRLIVRKFNNHIIDAEILTGSHLGKKMFISQINIIPSNFSIYHIYQ